MIRGLAAAGAAVIAATGLAALPAAATGSGPTPALRACSVDVHGDQYACMKVATAADPAGAVVTFTGQLSTRAQRTVREWTAGGNEVCLDRYKTKPEKDGSWPWQTLDQACTTVRSDGGFTLKVTLSKVGTFYYGLQAGPCRADPGMCGEGDPGLLGVGGKRAVAHRTS